MRIRSVLIIALLTVPLLGVAGGCSPVGSRFSDFRAYYNAFYNAQRAFEEGERAATSVTPAVDRTQYLSLYAHQPGAGAQQFRDAADKSVEMLRRHPESRLVDDALLLIGKSYFYLDNFVGAEQKFGEAIEAASLRGNSRLADEARVWRARTLASLQRYSEALDYLGQELERPEMDRRWRPHMLLVQGDVYLRARQLPEAAAALRAGIEELGSSDPVSRAQFLLGQVLEAQGEFSAAADAYGQVLRLRPEYELEYAAALQRALVLGLDVGRHDDALELVSRMRRDDRHRSHLAEVAISHARILGAAGRHGEAQALFRAVLYDDSGTYRLQDVRGQAYLHYAEFYRDELGDFVRASAYLDTAATAIQAPAAPSGVRRTRTAPIDVGRQAAVFASYATLARQVAEIDSLLVLGGLPEDELALRLQQIDDERIAAAEEQFRREQRLRQEAAFSGGATMTGRPEGDPADAAGASTAAGFLNYLNPVQVQQSRLAFQQVWGDRPHAENWRRGRAVGQAAVANPLSDPLERISQVSVFENLGLQPLDTSRIPRTAEAQLDTRAERAFLRYEMGNVLFLSMNRLDEARAVYQAIIEQDSDIAVYPRTLYALAELEIEAGNTDRATALYEKILEDDPTGPLADQARERLNLPSMAPEDDPDSERDRRARDAYESAYALWQLGQHSHAFVELIRVGETYSESIHGARALLAASVVFSEMARRMGLPIESPFNAVLAEASTADRAVHAGQEAGQPEAILSTHPEAPGDLNALYRAIMDRYPETPFAERAARLWEALDTDVQIEEDTPEPETAHEGQTDGEEGFDTSAPVEVLGAKGEWPLLPEYGGYTWEMAALPSSMAARALLDNYRRRGFRVAIYSDDEGLYRLVLGQFESSEAAEAARSELPDAPGGTPPRLLPLGALEFEDESQLMMQ